MKDSAAETTGVEEGESHTLGQGEETHTHTHSNLQIFYGEAGVRASVLLLHLLCLLFGSL